MKQSVGSVSPVLIHRGNSLHLRVCQFKVENIKVLGNVCLIAGTGDGDITSLQVPAEDDLGVGLAVLLGKLGELLGLGVMHMYGSECVRAIGVSNMNIGRLCLDSL